MTAQKIEITHKSILFTIFSIIAIYFVFFIRDIILMLFVAILIMAILNPMVTHLEKYKIPRGLSILLIYVAAIFIIVFGISGVVPPLLDQLRVFFQNISVFVNNHDNAGSILDEQIIGQINGFVSQITSEIPKATINIFSNLAQIVAVLILAFYLLASRSNFSGYSSFIFDKKTTEMLDSVLNHLEKRLGSWMIGQASLMFLVGASTYIGLLILGVPFSLPLAILAGILEIVPYIGPILSAVPLVIIGFGASPLLGVASLALAILIQQLENYVFVPKVMQKSTGVHPIVVIVSLAIGARIAGIVGVFLAVPVVITAQVILKEYRSKA